MTDGLPNKSKTLKYAISAFNASLIVQIVHPFDVIRTRLQSHDGSKQNLVPKYKGSFDALKTIYFQEGIRGLTKGLFVSLFANAIASGMFFALYEDAKDRLQENSRYNIIVASVYASVTSTIITQPMWVVKTRVLLNTETKNGLNNFISSCKQVYGQYGIHGFYRGLSISLLLCSHGIVQMNFYEYFTKQLSDYNQLVRPFTSGILSKICAIYMTYPLSTVRTRIQQNQFIEQDNQPKYRSIMDILQKTLKYEGIRGFYKGVTASVIRGLPSKGFYFFFYEYFKNYK